MSLEERLNLAVQQSITDLVAALDGLSEEQQTQTIIEGEYTIGQMAVLCLQVLDTRTCYCQAGERAIDWQTPPSTKECGSWPAVGELVAIAKRISGINDTYLSSVESVDLIKPSLYANQQEAPAFEAYLYALDYVAAQLRRIWYLRGRLGIGPIPRPLPEVGTCAPTTTGPKEQTPKEIAQAHYDAVRADDHDAWRLTLVAQYQQERSIRGTTPQLWWQTGHKYTHDLGIRYEYDHTDHHTDDECKLFFKRIERNGSQRGLPVPITLQHTDQGWRVITVSY